MVALALTSIEWTTPPVLPLGVPIPSDVAADFKKKYGSAGSSAFRRYTHVPWVLEWLAAPQPPLAYISYELVDLIHAVVSYDNSCRFCYGATRALLRMTGHAEARVQQIETDFHAADLDPKTRLVLDYARRISRSNPRPGSSEERALLEEGFSPEAIAEVAIHTVLCLSLNRLMTLTAIELSEFETLPDRWFAPLVRPVFGWMVRRERKMVPPRRFAPGANTGLAAPLLERFDGVPAAVALRLRIDHMLASETLPLRTRLLSLAVIARTLGCSASEAEALRGLVVQGLAPAEVMEILDHLASPRLTPLEAQLVPVARATVRYQQPGQIQRRMRELAAQVAPAQLLDAIGTFAIANALARLTVLLDRC